MRDFVLTSEAFTKGHPDKLSDQISDAIVDACLAGEPRHGVTAEAAIASGVVFLSIRSDAGLAFDAADTARRVIGEAGYHADAGAQTVMLDTAENATLRPPAGFEGVPARHMTTVFGYACAGVPAMMPYPVWAARGLARRLDAARESETLPWLSPDAQVQVAVAFADRRPRAVTGLAVTVPTGEQPISEGEIEDALREHVIGPFFASAPIGPDEETRLVINEISGAGGPAAHSGLTGRKTGADSYGSFCRQSSSAFSGKDPSRIDRVGVYAAHHAARMAVAAGLAGECEVQLSYVPGDEGPIGLEVDSFGSGRITDEAIAQRLSERLDFRLGAIMERFRLWELPALHGGRYYAELAAHGQLGREDIGAPWESTEGAGALA
jgi:S-adenosylmethionine synthetase